MNKNMKRIIKVIIILISLIIFNIFQLESKAETSEFFEVKSEKVLGLNFNYDVKEVIDGYLLTNEGEIKYFYQNIEIFNVKEEYFTHTQDPEFLYLISKNNEGFILRKIGKKNKVIDEVNLEISGIGDVILNNDEIIIVGSSKKDAIISKYSLNLKHLHTYYYGGESTEHFNKIYVQDNNYYIIGTKDAHSINSPFMNVGSINEQKVFLTQINNQGIILNTCYFNHEAQLEELVNSDYLNGQLMLRIKADDINHIYIMDSDLEKKDYFQYKNNPKSIIIFNNNLDYLIVEDYQGIMLKTKNNLQYDLNINSSLEYALIEDNVLTVYYYQDFYLQKASIYQYKIEHQEDIIINIFNGEFNEQIDMNELSEIKISSIIHKLNLELKKIEPFFNKQISGKYEALFKITINNQTSFELKNNIIIEEYLNVLNEHIYPVGYKLKFFGHGLLNGKTIISGASLNDTGEQTLVISDANGNQKKIAFYVVEDYYNKEEELPNTDYIINQNQIVKVKINNYSSEEVQEVYINNESVPFTIDNNQVVVELNNFNKMGIYQYTINKLVYQTREFKIDKHISVKVLKQSPVIQIKEAEQENLSLILNIDDPDKTLKDLVFEIYEEDKLWDVYHTYLKNYTLKLGNIQKDKKYNIKGFLVYDIGNGIMHKQQISDSILKFNMSAYNLGTVATNTNVDEIIIDLFTNDVNITIDKLLIGDVELKDKYQVVTDYLPVYISVGISIIIVIIGGGYYFFKKQQQKR